MTTPLQNTTSAADDRQALRRRMLALRQQLSDTQRARLTTALCDHLRAAIQPRPGQVVAFCWPIRGEPDLRPLLHGWRRQGIVTALPVVQAADAALAFRAWDETTPLQADRHGIPTPTAGAWLHPDILLIPVNAFDAAGYRLGYGGGYFDRSLATLQPRPLAVGVGFEINRVASILPEPHDQQLDWIVTEAGAFRSPG
jgi:5-formyltetrahydrofolate cyclo-ligase